MKQYWSIPNSSRAPRDKCVAFYKYDGSNIRCEWQKKKGWCKFGSRHQLIDESSDQFSDVVSIFNETLADGIEKVIRDEYRDIQLVTAFAEFVGPNSFAGTHDPLDKKELVLFDIALYRKGYIDPNTFIKQFGHLNTAKVIYKGNLTDTFIRDVRYNLYELNEGVVCKGGKGHKLWMCKIKTNEYIDRLKDHFGNDWKQYGE